MTMTGPRRNYRRGKVLVRTFTAAEDEQLSDMRVAGFSLKAIADQLGRGKSSVQLRLKALARRAADGDEPFPI
jgi:IS30 family transposase